MRRRSSGVSAICAELTLSETTLVVCLRSERGPHQVANQRASKLGLFKCFLVLGGLAAHAEDLIQIASFNVAR
jgi:hypothetical protein